VGFSRRMVFGVLADACRQVGNPLGAVRGALITLSGRYGGYRYPWGKRKRGIEVFMFTVDKESGFRTLL